uniref:Sad1 and UNC84 domain containing 1 n=1 Tax=Jaculus jaculus TaxID=51337 RepID=A0A8C5LDW9_JACJA
MDFSRLHTYTPPQCVLDNTGYTYALSSSYSSDALDFESEHKLDPVFDSPRMSRRSLRQATTNGQSVDAYSLPGRAAPVKETAARIAKQHRSASKPAFSINHLSGKGASSSFSQNSSCSSWSIGTSRPLVLDESLICEQTKVDHFWGLDDDGDLKGANKVPTQGNGDLSADVAASNGYTCPNCSMLSARTDVLTAHQATHMPTSRVYSRDRNSRQCGASFYMDRILWLAKYTSSSFSSVLVQLFQVVLMKLNYESETYQLKSYESKDYESKSYESKSHESKANHGHCGRMTAQELSRVDGESLCDDCKGKKHLETHTAIQQPSSPHRVAGAVGHLCTCTGDLLMQGLHRTKAAVRSVAQAVWLMLWLAITAPGKVASGTFWWLGSGWYQFVTLISWLNVFLLTRCLRNICKYFIMLLPLLLLLSTGFFLWDQDFLSFLRVLNWTAMHTAQPQVYDSEGKIRPDPASPSLPPQADFGASQWHQENGVAQQVAALTMQCHSYDQRLGELAVLLQKLQMRVDQVDSGREGLSLWVKDVVGQHLQEVAAAEARDTKTDFMTFHHDHEVRLSNVEDILRKLTEKSEAIQKELEETKLRANSWAEDQPLLDRVQRLELELGLLKSQLLEWQQLRAGCVQGDAHIRETVRLMFSEDQYSGFLESLLQNFSSRFVSRDELQVLLGDLELKVLKNITHHITVTGQAPTSEAIVSAVNEAGISGITEAQVHVIVNNALKLYSQDKTGMVDFALESGGGSILSTRCSETYETKTALLSLFGIPLWYFSQSPRVVIQPDIYPGNCWAFKGSQGYLVVRLSMMIHPTAVTMEHVPKALSPTGSISSAPRDFAVYGLENEYQEEGQLLGQFTYNQEGESLQVFHLMEGPDRAFQIVELRILSNWGHLEYTCLYRFRVHGEPVH